MAGREHLVRKHRTWYVRIKVPKRLRKDHPDRPPFLVRSLRTQSLAEANLRKLPVIAEFKRKLSFWEAAQTDPLAEVRRLGREYRESLDIAARAGVVVIPTDGNTQLDHDLPEVVDGEVRYRAIMLAQDGDPAAADLLLRAAFSRSTPIEEKFQPWQDADRQHVTNATRDRDRFCVDQLLAWAGKHATVEEFDRKKAREYVEHVRGLDISDSTKRAYVQHLAALWAWLVDQELAKENVWKGHKGPKTSKRGVKTAAAEGTRRQWTDDDIVKLLSGSWTPRYHQTLQDLIRLALATGARLNELCELARDAAEKREDGWWLDIREGKTQNAVRQLPVPAWAAHVLERRTQGEDEWLFPGLLPGGLDGRRSWYVSKAFAAYAKHLDFKGSGKVFHTLRNTYSEAMEAAGTPVPTLQLLMGHSRKETMGETATYTKGERLRLRDAVDQLRYGEDVMRLMKAGSGE